MNAAHRHAVADGWSFEYEFEDIEIEEDGIHFGSFWGTAELALNDPADTDFYVKHIAINGLMRPMTIARTSEGFTYKFRERKEVPLLIHRPAKDDRMFRAHLFRKLEAALYASREAQEHFSRELEDQ